jgi:hypothetical protein
MSPLALTTLGAGRPKPDPASSGTAVARVARRALAGMTRRTAKPLLAMRLAAESTAFHARRETIGTIHTNVVGPVSRACASRGLLDEGRL